MFTYGISRVSSRFMSLIIITMFSLRTSGSKANDTGRDSLLADCEGSHVYISNVARGKKKRKKKRGFDGDEPRRRAFTAGANEAAKGTDSKQRHAFNSTESSGSKEV